MYNPNELVVFVLAGVQGCHSGSLCMENQNEAKRHAQQNLEYKDTHTPLSEKIKEERLCNNEFGSIEVGKAMNTQSFPLEEHFQRLRIEPQRLRMCSIGL